MQYFVNSIDQTSLLNNPMNTLSLKIVLENDFSDTAYNSAPVSHIQSLIAKTYITTIFRQIYCDTRCLVRYGLYK